MTEDGRKLPGQEFKRVFETAPFVSSVGIELVSVSPGFAETELRIRPDHLQQDGYVHAGVQATMADHTAGGAAASLIGTDQFVLTAEFKINFLRAAKGEKLRCRATVLKPGSNLTVVESEVYSEDGETSRLVSKATASMAVLRKAREI